MCMEESSMSSYKFKQSETSVLFIYLGGFC